MDQCGDAHRDLPLPLSSQISPSPSSHQNHTANFFLLVFSSKTTQRICSTFHASINAMLILEAVGECKITINTKWKANNHNLSSNRFVYVPKNISLYHIQSSIFGFLNKVWPHLQHFPSKFKNHAEVREREREGKKKTSGVLRG